MKDGAAAMAKPRLDCTPIPTIATRCSGVGVKVEFDRVTRVFFVALSEFVACRKSCTPSEKVS